MALKHHIERLCKEMKMEGLLPTDSVGVYQFPANERATVAISETDRGCLFYSIVCPSPGEREELLFQDMLLGNLYGQGTYGAVIGLTSDGKMITLSRELLDNFDYREFRDALEDFLNGIDFWTDEVDQVMK